MSNYVWGSNETQFFYQLDPETILDSIESLGLDPTGRLLALNSMENRVYEIDLEDAPPIVAKFYRPGRWSDDQILEEHEFLHDLESNDIGVIAPMSFDGKTLFHTKTGNLSFTVFPKKGGRAPDEPSHETLEILGRMLARIHNCGFSRKSQHRLSLTLDTFGRSNLEFLIKEKAIPSHLESPYSKAVEDICRESEQYFKDIEYGRIHGDCHIGNIIWRDGEGAFFIDFDDMSYGPAVQDIWPIIPGTDQESLAKREIFLEAYEQMRHFNRRELKLIETLRALRFIHFSAWIAKRWEDESFKRAFPFFADHHYFDNQLRDLQIQLQLIKNQSQPLYY